MEHALVEIPMEVVDVGYAEMLRQHRGGPSQQETHWGTRGQGPSDFPELAMRLVEFGIDSMSLHPEKVIPTRQAVANAEARVRTLAVPVGR